MKQSIICLPKAVIVPIFIEWVEITDIGYLDCAITSSRLRPVFQELLTTSVFYGKSTLNLGYFQWIAARSIAVSTLVLPKEESCQVIVAQVKTLEVRFPMANINGFKALLEVIMEKMTTDDVEKCFGLLANTRVTTVRIGNAEGVFRVSSFTSLQNIQNLRVAEFKNCRIEFAPMLDFVIANPGVLLYKDSNVDFSCSAGSINLSSYVGNTPLGQLIAAFPALRRLCTTHLDVRTLQLLKEKHASSLEEVEFEEFDLILRRCLPDLLTACTRLRKVCLGNSLSLLDLDRVMASQRGSLQELKTMNFHFTAASDKIVFGGGGKPGSKCIFSDDELRQFFAQNLGSFRQLHFVRCSSISDELFHHISRSLQESLRGVHIEGCDKVSANAAAALAPCSLTSLHLLECLLIDEEALVQVARSLPSLQLLAYASHPFIRQKCTLDVVATAVVDFLPSIRSLELLVNYHVSLISLEPIVRYCAQLQSLAVNHHSYNSRRRALNVRGTTSSRFEMNEFLLSVQRSNVTPTSGLREFGCMDCDVKTVPWHTLSQRYGCSLEVVSMHGCGAIYIDVLWAFAASCSCLTDFNMFVSIACTRSDDAVSVNEDRGSEDCVATPSADEMEQWVALMVRNNPSLVSISTLYFRYDRSAQVLVLSRADWFQQGFVRHACLFVFSITQLQFTNPRNSRSSALAASFSSDSVLDICAACHSTLQTLKIQQDHLALSLLCSVVTMCAQLRTLVVSSRTAIDDELLATIAASCCHLRNLELEQCQEVTFSALQGLVRGCSDLRYARLDHASALEDKDITPLRRPRLRLDIRPSRGSSSSKK